MYAKQITSQGTPGHWPPCYCMMSTWVPTGNANAMCPKQISCIPLPTGTSYALLISVNGTSIIPVIQGLVSLLTQLFHTTRIKSQNKSCRSSLPNLPRMRPRLTASPAPVLAKPAPSHWENKHHAQAVVCMPPPHCTTAPVSCWSFTCTCTSASVSTLVSAVGIPSALCTVAFRCPSQSFADHPA